MIAGRFSTLLLAGLTLTAGLVPGSPATANPVLAKATTAHPPAANPATAHPVATVSSPNQRLNIRSAPSRASKRIGSLSDGTVIGPVCQVVGQLGTGQQRRTRMWDRLPSGGYVSDGYVRHDGSLPACAENRLHISAQSLRAHWTTPLPGFAVQGGFRTELRPNHQGVDIMSFAGTPVHAAADGVVVEVVCDIQPGGSCDVPGSPDSRGCGWYVKLRHPGNVATLYCHLQRRPIVKPGQRIRAGEMIGVVGTSGRSSFPHLHYEVHLNAPPTHPWNAVDPLEFMASVGATLPLGS